MSGPQRSAEPRSGRLLPLALAMASPSGLGSNRDRESFGRLAASRMQGLQLLQRLRQGRPAPPPEKWGWLACLARLTSRDPGVHATRGSGSIMVADFSMRKRESHPALSSLDRAEALHEGVVKTATACAISTAPSSPGQTKLRRFVVVALNWGWKLGVEA